MPNDKTNYLAGGLIAMAMLCATALCIAGKMPVETVEKAIGAVIVMGATAFTAGKGGAASTVVNSLGGLVGVKEGEVKK